MTAVRDSVRTAAGSPYQDADRPSGLAVMWRHRRWLVVVPALSCTVGLIVLLLLPNYYRSRVTFIPVSKSTSGMGNLAELALAAGVGGVSPSNPSSPQFYQQVLSSTPIVYNVLQTRYKAPARGYDVAGADSVRLFELLSSPTRTTPERLADAASKLVKNRLATDLDRRTGIVGVSVTLNDPVLAASVASEFVKQVGSFNRNTLQTQARARRIFTEARAAEAGQVLNASEDALRRFLQTNRQWRDAPTLVFEQERLQRQVNLNQDLYLSLRRELDQARIAEVDDTPTITVIEPALVPVRKAGPRRLLTLFGILVMSIAATALAITVDSLRRRLLPELRSV